MGRTKCNKSRKESGLYTRCSGKGGGGGKKKYVGKKKKVIKNAQFTRKERPK